MKKSAAFRLAAANQVGAKPAHRGGWLTSLSTLRLGLSITMRAAPTQLVRDSFALLALAILAGVRPGLYAEVVEELLHLSSDGDTGRLIEAGLRLALVVSLSAGIAQFRSYDADVLAERVGTHANELIARKAAEIPLLRLEDHEFLNTLQRATAEAPFRPIQLVRAMQSMFQGLAISAGLTVGLGLLAPIAVPFALVVYIPSTWGLMRRNRSSMLLAKSLTKLERERALYPTLVSNRRSAYEIRSFGMAPLFIKRFMDLSGTRLRAVVRFKHRQMLEHLAFGLGSALVGTAMILWLITATSGFASAGLTLATVVVMQSLYFAVGQAYLGFAQLHDSATFLSDVELVLNEPTVPDSAFVLSQQQLNFVVGNSLTFAYPGSTRNVLEDVSLELVRGKILAVVGPNGAGKTTLAKVVAGLFEPTRGDLSFGPGSILRVPFFGQQFLRLPLSLFDNIAVGAPARYGDRELVDAVAKEVGLASLIDGLPEGMESILGRELGGSVDLSFGEWQRVGIARALLGAASLLILDEPFASLDPAAEEELVGLLTASRDQRGVMLMSHRLGTVREADEIVFLQAGRVIERGSHSELMKARGEYYRLFRLQEQRYR